MAGRGDASQDDTNGSPPVILKQGVGHRSPDRRFIAGRTAVPMVDHHDGWAVRRPGMGLNDGRTMAGLIDAPCLPLAWGALESGGTLTCTSGCAPSDMGTGNDPSGSIRPASENHRSRVVIDETITRIGF